MLEKTAFTVGWAVAVAAGAWWWSLGGVASGGAPCGNDDEAGRGAAIAAAKAPLADVADRGVVVGKTPPKSKKSVAEKPKKWCPEDKWNVPALYGILGKVPPEVQVVADRIRDAHAKVMRGEDLTEIFDCVADAKTCPNPIVRAMMVDALRLCAMKARWFAFDGATDEENKRLRDDAEMEAIEYAKAFVADRNKFVAKNATDAIFHGVKGIEDDARRYAAFEDAVVATGGEICRANLNAIGYKGLVCDLHATTGDGRISYLLALARGIEKLGDGEGRRLAEDLYREETGDEFPGVKSLEEMQTWMADLKDAGTQLFGTASKGVKFAEAMERETRDDKDKFTGKDEAVESASRKFSDPSVALASVELEERLKKSAFDLYGDTEKALEWFQEEMEFYGNALKKANDILESIR